MRIMIGVLAGAAAAATVMLAAPTANADTGACVSYLENIGQDTTARVQLCAETETVGDVVSQQYAMGVCVLGMQVSGLPPVQSAEACHLAVSP